MVLMTLNSLYNKTSFVLGRFPHVDFVVNDEHIAKEHVSFFRDINGICINPLPEHKVLVNGKPITDPEFHPTIRL